MQILTRRNKVIDYCNDGYMCMGCTVVCESKGLIFEDCTIIDIDADLLPSDIGNYDYYYIDGVFIRDEHEYTNCEIDEMFNAVQVKLAGIRKTFTATLSTTWNGSTAPYTQSVYISGILESDMPHITPVYSDDLASALAQKDTWEAINYASTADGSITFFCYEDKPVTALTVQVEVIR